MLFLGNINFKEKRILSSGPSKYICIKNWIVGNIFHLLVINHYHVNVFCLYKLNRHKSKEDKKKL